MPDSQSVSVTTELRVRILVCDDNRDAAQTLAALCQAVAPRAKVDVCFSGSDCIDKAHSWRPDFLLLDIGMPGMNGYEVARHLRGIKESCDIFIVVISGWATKSDREKSAAAGVDLHYAKPISMEALLELLVKRRPTQR